MEELGESGMNRNCRKFCIVAMNSHCKGFGQMLTSKAGVRIIGVRCAPVAELAYAAG